MIEHCAFKKKCIKLIIFFFFFISLLNIFSIGNICRAENENIFYVGGKSSENYTLVQDAVDNSSDGDTIFIFNGSYFENIIINKSISLIGEDENSVFIDGSKNIYSILVKSSNFNISGITILNSQIGIYIIDHNLGVINISKNIFFDNYEGIRIYNSSNIEISKNIVYNNSEIGIVSHESKNIEIFENNFSKNFKGVHLGRWSNYFLISKNNFSENKFGLYLYFSSNNNITINDFFENNYGTYLKNSVNNSLTYNIFEKNLVSAIGLENIEENILEPNLFYDNKVNIKESSKPPKIKAPGFEFLFMVCTVLLLLGLKKFSK